MTNGLKITGFIYGDKNIDTNEVYNDFIEFVESKGLYTTCSAIQIKDIDADDLEEVSVFEKIE